LCPQTTRGADQVTEKKNKRGDMVVHNNKNGPKGTSAEKKKGSDGATQRGKDVVVA